MADKAIILGGRWDNSDYPFEYGSTILRATSTCRQRGKEWVAACELAVVGVDVGGDLTRHVLVDVDLTGSTSQSAEAIGTAFLQEQMDKAVKALKEAFYVDPNGSPR